jgi:hypothetical protein
VHVVPVSRICSNTERRVLHARATAINQATSTPAAAKPNRTCVSRLAPSTRRLAPLSRRRFACVGIMLALTLQGCDSTTSHHPLVSPLHSRHPHAWHPLTDALECRRLRLLEHNLQLDDRQLLSVLIGSPQRCLHWRCHRRRRSSQFGRGSTDSASGLRHHERAERRKPRSTANGHMGGNALRAAHPYR